MVLNSGEGIPSGICDDLISNHCPHTFLTLVSVTFRPLFFPAEEAHS